MAIKRYKDWRQFYINYVDGRSENYGEPRLISVPRRTKAWKELQTIFQRSEIKSIGWRTVKI